MDEINDSNNFLFLGLVEGVLYKLKYAFTRGDFTES